MNQKTKNILFIVLALMLLPAKAYANAGTPLIWGGFLHLAIGNLFIGIAEEWLLSRVCKESTRKCVGVMILANYLSAWIGGLGLAFLSEAYIPWSVENVKGLFLALVFACWTLTVLLEYPFIWLAMKKQEHAGRRSWKYSLLTQTTSYILLIGWYLLCGSYSLLTQCDIVSINDIPLQEKVCIYYISAENDGVYGIRPGQKDVYVDQLEKNGDDELWLVCIPSSPESEQVSLRYVSGNYNKNYLNDKVLIKDIARRENAILDYPRKDFFQAEKYMDPFWLWDCRCLGNAKDSDVHFKHGFWPCEGIYLCKRNPNSPRTKAYDDVKEEPNDTQIYGYDRANWQQGKCRLFALETPFLGWQVRNIIQLPSDVCILQLGRDQICLFDYHTMRLTLLARGYGAVAVLE